MVHSLNDCLQKVRIDSPSSIFSGQQQQQQQQDVTSTTTATWRHGCARQREAPAKGRNTAYESSAKRP